jgi:hypothetical protein
MGVVLAVALLATTAGFMWFRTLTTRRAPTDGLPRPGTVLYTDMVSAFQAGIAALLVDANDRAKEKLERATRLVPGEPSA